MKHNLEIIEDVKIRLRPISLDDTKLIVKWRNMPSVKNNFIFRDVFTEEMHINWMKTKVAYGEVIQYIIEEKETNRPIGSVYLRDIDKNHNSAEYGIFIGEEDSRGKGYGTKAAEIFVNHMFEKLKLHRIFLRVLAGNDSAYRSYEKIGFIKEGIARDMIRVDGKYEDVIFMSIINQKETVENE